MRRMNFTTQEKAKESMKNHEIEGKLFNKLTQEQKESVEEFKNLVFETEKARK